MKGKKVKFQRTPNYVYFLTLFNPLCITKIVRNIICIFAYYYVNYIYGRFNAKIGKSKIHSTVIIRQGERVIIGDNCLINHNNVLQAGKVSGKIIIGNYVQTGPNVMIFAFNHSIEKNNVPMIEQDYYDADVIIEDDVWIGAGTVILAGVKIGSGCVIGAGSVVTKNVPSNSIVAGVPAKFVKDR